MSPVLSTCRHETDPETLMKIVEKFEEWQRTKTDAKWPTLIGGKPFGLGSDLGHTVVMVLEGTDEQIENVTWHFYNLLDMSHDTLYDVMATSSSELKKVLGMEETRES